MHQAIHRGRRTMVVVAGVAAATTSAVVAIAPASASHGSGRLFVPGGAEPWVATGITLAEGQQFIARAEGTGITWLGMGPGSISGPAGQSTPCEEANTGTPCAIEGDPYGALVARVGGTTFYIGAGGGFTAPADGELELAVNDNAGSYDDNSGGYAVSIRVG